MNQQRNARRGRKAILSGDLVIAACLSTYFNRPSRKATGWPRLLAEKLFVRAAAPSAVRLRAEMRKSSFSAQLREAIDLVSNTVRNLETRFAVDSSYYKTPNYSLHVQRMGKGIRILEKVKNAKLHLAVGVNSLMVVAATVTNGDDHDSPHFRTLLKQIGRRFRIDEVMADAAYDFPDNYEAVHHYGGKAFIDQKTGTKRSGPPHYNEMVRMRADNFDAWHERYRFRDLVECANSVMKRTIKRVIRARLEVSRDNELLLVCLVHNLCRLIEARIAYGVPIAWASPEALAAIDIIASKYPKAA